MPNMANPTYKITFVFAFGSKIQAMAGKIFIMIMDFLRPIESTMKLESIFPIGWTMYKILAVSKLTRKQNAFLCYFKLIVYKKWNEIELI